MRGSKLLQKMDGKASVAVLGIFSVIAVMLLLLWANTINSQQSTPAIFPDVFFEGQYRIGDGEWETVRTGKHIPSTRGDVMLRGQFHLTVADGEYLGPAEAGVMLAFYINHIQITVEEQGAEPFVLDMEQGEVGEGMCGEHCIGYALTTAEPVTLTFRNPHRFGNETAIDEFLRELSVYADFSFEKEFVAQGNRERTFGLVFVIAAFVVLGTALFSAVLHIGRDSKLWLIGLSVLFAGGYFVYGATGVSFWSNSIIGNTTILGICMMLYMLCVSALMVSVLGEGMREVGKWTVVFLGAACVVIALVCLLTDVRFYDTWLWWAVIQSAVNAVFFVCILMSFPGASKGKAISSVGAAILMLGFEADLLGTAAGWWKGGAVCKAVFMLLFVVAMVLVWQIIPRNIKTAEKAREMEAEQKAIRAQMQENRVAIMISQIQPHFIYNTLGTIQQLCKANPEQAADLVHRFSVYLRGNFSELDSTAPIRFTQELQHVHCYTEIELVRFPDMTVRYDIQADEFLLPALTVQPLVENAIKHGLMGLEEGGTVTVSAYETDTCYCVDVTDDGVGFDTAAIQDKKKHIGIRNVRERLELMCGGSLTVESRIGKGTKAQIRIPKEGKEL